jgi:predicted nucleic acid-binding protein
MLEEHMTLSRLDGLIVVNVSPQVLRASMKLVLKHHIYVADALQVASAKKVNSRVMVTGGQEVGQYS